MGETKYNVAYFSMEIGVHEDMHTYSGGLGVLSGDTLKSCADLNISVVAVSLLHEKGYFKQKLSDNGSQTEEPDPWFKEDYLEDLNTQVTIKICGRDVVVKAYKYSLKGTLGEVPIIFLDTNIESNSDYDKNLTSHLYGGDHFYRLCQEIVLGVGGYKMLKALGIDVSKYHMNEGHAGFLTLPLLQDMDKDIEKVKQRCVFTTHTPVPAGHDSFSHQQVKEALAGYDEGILRMIEIGSGVNMTKLAMKFSKYINAVARKHGEVSRKMFPGEDIKSITNGVHTNTWVCSHMKSVFDKHLSSWVESPEALREALKIHDDDIWRAHIDAKSDLFDYIKKNYDEDFDVETFTIGFARRATGYKRATLLFNDLKWLKSMSEKVGPIQIVYGGKAHPNDFQGKEYIQSIIERASHLDGNIKFVYLENYDMEIAKLLVSGVDLWLNTPLRPNEASGTSGMKAAQNGVPSFSVLDGWWIEGHMENLTGWSIGDSYQEGQNQDEVDSESIYRKLETIILPTYYNDKAKWINIMKHCIAINGSYFNTHRMVKEYVSKAYFL